MKDKKKQQLGKLDRLLELPITGFDEMVIENFKGILEYEEFYVRINTYIGIININGYQLNLENMTDDDIKVTGKIESFDFERIIDEGD